MLNVPRKAGIHIARLLGFDQAEESDGAARRADGDPLLEQQLAETAIGLAPLGIVQRASHVRVQDAELGGV